MPYSRLCWVRERSDPCIPKWTLASAHVSHTPPVIKIISLPVSLFSLETKLLKALLLITSDKKYDSWTFQNPEGYSGRGGFWLQSLEQPLRRLLGDEREERTREMCVLSHTVPTALQEGGWSHFTEKQQDSEICSDFSKVTQGLTELGLGPVSSMLFARGITAEVRPYIPITANTAAGIRGFPWIPSLGVSWTGSYTGILLRLWC